MTKNLRFPRLDGRRVSFFEKKKITLNSDLLVSGENMLAA
jgi:hypothetical protein